jgi:predicted SAM-dependent methyltransferase
MSRLLNLGCGFCHHPAFTNIDFVSSAPTVIACDLRKGIPFPAGSFDLVYHSHVLEHFDLPGARSLLRECHRVLAPGGMIRVSVPDLAQWARVYLQTLEAAARNEPDAAGRHAWMQVELLDQMVRKRTGGVFVDFIRQAPDSLRPFIESRVGPYSEFLPPDEAAQNAAPSRSDWKARLRPLVRWLKSPEVRRARRIRRALGADFAAWETARFRERGEIHQWMHDAVSLGRELTQTGFTDVVVCDATTSGHAGWETFHLDTFSDGSVRRPNSLYIEARRSTA